MKLSLVLILSLIFINPLTAQDFGVSIGGATSSSIILDGFYKQENNSFHIGISYEISDTRGKLVSEQKPNYGRTQDGSGTYFFTVDFGYGYHFKNKISAFAELSIGSNNNYTNYLDGRFNDGGYHLITQRDPIIGLGAIIGYSFTENISGFIGVNSIRKLSLGLRFSFPIMVNN